MGRVVSRLRLRQPATKRTVVELVVRGPIGRWFTRRRWAGFTLPLPFVTVIFYWHTGTPSPYTRVHEFVHVAQDEANALFAMTCVKYVVELARHGYRRNCYEVAAYRVEDDAREIGLPEWARPD
jgi:hypothetical protein